MSDPQGIVINMTKKITAALMTAMVGIIALVIGASPAQAAVNEHSRVVAIDLPKAVERATTATVYLTLADGSMQAFTAPSENGVMSVLAERPDQLVGVAVKVGKKRIKPDNYIITNLVPVPETFGMTMGCPRQNAQGENVMVRVDGSLITLDTGATTPTVTLP